MKKQTLDLAKLDVESLKEFDGFALSQNQILDDNKFIEVVDNKSYEAAKKAAHALLKGRTGLESQEKVVVKKLQEFRKQIGSATSVLIEITIGAEKKQKTEIQKYEDRKAEEKRLKEEAAAKILEELRKDIDAIDDTTTEAIENMTYEKIVKVGKMLEGLNDIDGTIFGGLEELFDDTCILLRERFNTKKRGVTIAFEQAKKEKELAAREAKLKKEEAARKAKAKKEAEQRKKDDEARERADKENKMAALQSSHVIMLLKAGYAEGKSNEFSKGGQKILISIFTNRGGNLQYNACDADIEEFIAKGQKIELRVDTLNEYKDLISIEEFDEALRLSDNDFQRQINQLVDQRAEASQTTIEVTEVTDEEIQIDPKDIIVVDVEVVSDLEEKPKYSADKMKLASFFNSMAFESIKGKIKSEEAGTFLLEYSNSFYKLQAEVIDALKQQKF